MRPGPQELQNSRECGAIIKLALLV